MKKIIVLPNATEDVLVRVAEQISKMTEDGCLLVQKDIKIYDIDNAEVWTKKQIKEFVESYGMKIK